ncbi:MurR/RpiR family transcriptional regulator [Streptomyces sp. ODS28]|uniref:MurR/RpiR family transcriptional regulator n=1 Tax=Streptomyces sp. ODS28 TaxID=3136688 RepID=UPI0031EF72CA
MNATDSTDPGPSRTVPLHERVAAMSARLAPRERLVADFLRDHPGKAVSLSAAELGRSTGTSDATVIRAVKALGYAGLRELKRDLAEAMAVRRDPARVLDQRLERAATSSAQIGDQVLADGAALFQQARQLLDPAAWESAVGLLQGARSVLCYGIGPAATVAEFLSLSLTRSGVSSRAMGTTGFRIADALVPLAEGDVVVLIAPLRRFREMGVVLDHARDVGARVILISETLGMALEDRVDVLLATPESTSGTAGETFVPMALCQGLVIDVAARTRDRALTAHTLLNRLREEAAGPGLDLGALPTGEGAVGESPGTPQE